MANYSRVIWYEGMPLMPQHFQQQDRYYHNYISSFSNVLSPYNWGVRSLKIDSGLLAAGKISVVSASGFFADGTSFDFPYNDQLPIAIEIAPAAKDLIVYLAVPLSRLGVADTSLASQTESRVKYYSVDISVTDQNETNNATSQDIQLGQLNARLIIDSDTKHYFSYVPICKVKLVTAENAIILDDEYIPSCLNTTASDILMRFIDEVTALLQSRGDTLAHQVKDITNCGMSELKDFLILQRINYYHVQLIHSQHKKNLHPEQLYIMLVGLIAEFSTYTEESHRPEFIPPYNHEDLQQSFIPLFIAIRYSLSKILEQNSIALNLEEKEKQLFIAQIEDFELLDTAKFILVVNSSISEEKLKLIIPKQVKVATAERIKKYITHAIKGLPLRYMAIPPRQLPSNMGAAYFEIDKQSTLWESLKNSHGIAVHFNGVIPNLKVELWAIKGI